MAGGCLCFALREFVTPRKNARARVPVLQELFVGVELAVFAGVVERDVAVRTLFALVYFATVERLRVDVDADGALVEFGQVQNLMNGLEGIYVDRMCGVHFVDFRGNDFTGAA